MPRPGRHLAVLLATVVLSCGLLAACSSTPRIAVHHGHSQVTATSGPSTTVVSPTTAPRASASGPSVATSATTSITASPPTSIAHPAAAPTSSSGFVGSVSAVSAAQVSATWRPGCPVGPAQLRLLTMSYWGFDGQSHTGTLVVNSSVTSAVLRVFAALFAEHFPIHAMQPEDVYGGSDPVSMANDNTSGFNCRYAVAPGPPSWSVHASGEAIDVNPVENPYLEGGQVQPPAGGPYLDRADVRPGMAVAGGQLVEAFESVGWQWGGRWTTSPDYQHFSATGG